MYRASKDGFRAVNFHRKCDDKTKTLTIIKSINKNIFGGYTDATWTSNNQYFQDPNAFLFSLVNHDHKPFKTKIFSNGQNAIYCHPSYGPTFGGGNDIHISCNSNTNSDSYSNFGFSYKYPKYSYKTTKAKSILAGAYDFQTVEIEVFAKI